MVSEDAGNGTAEDAKNLKEAPTVLKRVLKSYTSLTGAVFFCIKSAHVSLTTGTKGGEINDDSR